MSASEFYRFLHILSSMVWVGGSVMTQVFGARIGRSGDRAQTLTFVKGAAAASRVLSIAGLSTAVWGILLVIDIEIYEFQQAWIVLGFGGVAVGALLGGMFFGPQIRKLIGQLESGDDSADETISRIVLVSAFELVVLVVVVWAMVVKPGL